MIENVQLSPESMARIDAMVQKARIRIFIDAERFLHENNLPSSFQLSSKFFRDHLVYESAIYQVTPFDRVRIL
jgi:hypothetical protein